MIYCGAKAGDIEILLARSLARLAVVIFEHLESTKAGKKARKKVGVGATPLPAAPAPSPEPPGASKALGPQRAQPTRAVPPPAAVRPRPSIADGCKISYNRLYLYYLVLASSTAVVL